MNTGGYEDITVLFQTMFCEHVGSLPDPSWVKLINLEYILVGGERREASNVSLVLNQPHLLSPLSPPLFYIPGRMSNYRVGFALSAVVLMVWCQVGFDMFSWICQVFPFFYCSRKTTGSKSGVRRGFLGYVAIIP